MKLKYPLLLPAALTAMLFTMSCGSNDDYIPLKQQTKPKANDTHQQYAFSVYLENSGSLNGYLKVTGDKNFKNNIYSLITAINTSEEKQTLSLYDVNTRIIPVFIEADAEQVNDYITNLNEMTFRKRSQEGNGNQSQSNLQAVLKMILDSTGTNEVSVLISDGVFSPGKNRNAEDYLSQQQHAIQNFINDKLKTQRLSMLALQFDSEFKGRYYYQDNSSKDGYFNKRPYYAICIGPEAALKNLLEKVAVQKTFKGFRNFMFLTPSGKYEVRPQIYNATAYYEYDMDVPMTVTHAQKGARDNKFRIKFGVDFSKLPVSEAYINSPDYYLVSNDYHIESIARSDKERFTHEITLVSDKLQTGKLKFSLQKQLPDWVITSNLDTDRGLPADSLEGKTFGILYLLKGMYSAYEEHTHTPDYFTFPISVRD